MASFRYAYLHGFLSSPLSHKALNLQKRLGNVGVKLDILDLSKGGGYAYVRYSTGIRAIDQYYASECEPNSGESLRLIGSSMGGYLCARYANLHPDRVDKIAMLNPAFDLVNRWPNILGERDWNLWKANGVHNFEVPSTKERVDVPYAYIEDALSHPPFPAIQCEAIVVHGVYDTVVPVEFSRKFREGFPDLVELVELEDDHAMTKEKSQEDIFKCLCRFFEIDPTVDG